MGRGRAKAKQTKIARDLKYSDVHLDPEALKRELASDPFAVRTPGSAAADDEDDDTETDEDDR